MKTIATKFIYIFILTLSFNAYTQALDSSIISNLTPSQILQIQELSSSSNNSVKVGDEPLNSTIVPETLVNGKSQSDANQVKGKKYGYDFFSTMPTSLAAFGDLPLPTDYKVSLRDEFRVILSGSKEGTFNLNVKLDGTILFPGLGSISVVGITFAELKDKLSKLIAQSYIGVEIDVSIQNLSAKKITIVGAVKSPGTYLVNPFTTITGALAYSGGISEIGSLRNIYLIRNSGESFSFDLYDLLINGDRSKDISIQAGDTILINAASQFVEINGAVKRPAIYEILENETLSDILNYSLGFTQAANRENINISFLNLEESSINKITTNNLNQKLTSALSVKVFEYVSKTKASIRIKGAVEEPGFYSLEDYENLDDLINGLKFIDVYPWLGVLEQFDDNNLVKSTILFNLNDPSTYNSIKLLPNSTIYFSNINLREYDVSETALSLIDEYKLTINHKQGTFGLPVYGKYSVKSFVDLLGLDMTSVDNIATYISPLENIVDNDDYKNMHYSAKKYNTVSFRSPVNDLIQVNILGAIDYPGVYTLEPNTTLKELYKLVGNFKKEAFLDGIIFTRESIRDRQLKSIEKSKKDLNTALLTSMQKGNDIGDINIINALSDTIDPQYLGRIAGNFNPNSGTAVETTLFDGDEIIIPKRPNIINVLGEVLNPTAFEYSKKISVRSAINQAGGYQQYADKKRVYIIKANGMIERANRNIFSGNTNLTPGDTIIVPRKIYTNREGIDALIPLTQILSDIAFSAAALESLSNNN